MRQIMKQLFISLKKKYLTYIQINLLIIKVKHQILSNDLLKSYEEIHNNMTLSSI